MQLRKRSGRNEEDGVRLIQSLGQGPAGYIPGGEGKERKKLGRRDDKARWGMWTSAPSSLYVHVASSVAGERRDVFQGDSAIGPSVAQRVLRHLREHDDIFFIDCHHRYLVIAVPSRFESVYSMSFFHHFP